MLNKKNIVHTMDTYLRSFDPNILGDNRLNLYLVIYGGRQFLMDNDEDIRKMLEQFDFSEEDLKSLYRMVKGYQGKFNIINNKCLSVIINGYEIAKLYSYKDIFDFLKNVEYLANRKYLENFVAEMEGN